MDFLLHFTVAILHVVYLDNLLVDLNVTREIQKKEYLLVVHLDKLFVDRTGIGNAKEQKS